MKAYITTHFTQIIAGLTLCMPVLATLSNLYIAHII